MIELKLKGIIAGYILLTTMEELGRKGVLVRRQKAAAKNAIKSLKYNEVLIEQIDNAGNQEKMDEILKTWDEFINECTDVNLDQISYLTEVLKKAKHEQI